MVGKASPAYAAEIERRFDSVRFHANVPEVAPYLQQARLGLIAETIGGGFKLKTLDYVFQQVPIAALETALAGIELRPGRDAIIEATLPALVASMVRAIDDFPFLNTAASRAFALCADRFRWSDRGSAMLQAIYRLQAPFGR